MRRDDNDKFTPLLRNIPNQPGVYKMINANGEVIYVGKAANLKKRVSSYFKQHGQDIKTLALVTHIDHIDTIITHTEGEALLLENNLIKSLKPRYNILYRDDKSYPYIFISINEAFPRLAFHRGAQRAKGRYFGPYPSAGAVRETLQLLQKLFPVRQCEDSFFNNRSRPCLQYQIKRCTAPCVGLVSESQYKDEVRHAILFLEGRSNDLITELVSRMDAASAKLEFEHAASVRDQISSLRRVQEKQYINQAEGDCDIIAAAAERGVGCIQVFTIRGGRNLGNKTFFPKCGTGDDSQSLLDAFLPQYYLRSNNSLSRDIPTLILLSEAIENEPLLQTLLTQLAGHELQLTHSSRGQRRKWLTMAMQNAHATLQAHLLSHSTLLQRFAALQEALDVDEMPEHIECFDISHTMGEATVASCVVFNRYGPLRADYRRFNITDVTPGDDYAAMEQALLRRYRKLEQGEGKIPDIIFIDGGKGQLHRAQAVLNELQLGYIMLLGIAKGPTRRPGQETLILAGRLSDQEREFILPADSMALHLIQQIRDEAHRFAISGHRQRRQKARTHSVLEDISGLGPKRRQQLLRHFGGLQEIARAGVDDLSSVPGIDAPLAQRIYATFHEDA